MWITDAGKNIAFYQKEPMGFYNTEKRNNFLHPVMLPDGTTITENAPDDHPHHRGIFWGWHQILIDGQQVSDSWDLKNFESNVKSLEFRRVKNGDGELRTTSFWSSPNYKSGEEPYLKEITSFYFERQKSNYRVIDITISLTSQVENLALGGSDDEKGYGGFSARIKLPADVVFKSDRGGLIQPKNEAVSAGDYVNISGSFARKGNAPGGVLIYADPENPLKNDHWILRSQASMQNAVFPGCTPYQLEMGSPLVLKYKLVLYTGKIKEKKILKAVLGAERSTLEL